MMRAGPGRTPTHMQTSGRPVRMKDGLRGPAKAGPIRHRRTIKDVKLKKAYVRRAGRWLAAAAAAGFACFGYMYLTLPDVRPLKTSNPATTAFIELRAQEARARGEQPRRVQHWVSYRRMSRNITRAVLAAEDDAFWQHEGVDIEQLQESLEADWASGRFLRGGSTITQQLAKNLYLSPSKNPLRKLKELIIARRLEAELDKSRILELYLNVIEWGDGIYGVEAAARTFSHRCGYARAVGVGDACGRDRQSTRAQPGASQRASASASGNHPAPHGLRDAASGCSGRHGVTL
jgi:membrane peptidoglycan carboxypeptidase